MDSYIIITQDFANTMQGKASTVNANNIFGYAVTTDGRYVCAANSQSDFPDDFSAFEPLTIVSLDSNQFPTSVPSLLNQ